MGAKGVKRKATATNKAAKLPVRARSNEPAQPEAAKGTMMVFDDDDDEGDQIVSTKLSSIEKPVSRATIPDSEEDEDSDDDDEAPEATSTQNIASNAEQLAAAASKAAEELAATQKRKRRERDALFKQQATSRKSKPTLAEDGDSDSEESSKPTKTNIPALLPEEFLTDESEPDSDAESSGDMDDRPKRRRVAHVERTLTRLDRGPADERVGSTMFSVAKTKTDPRLPPKMNKNAKHRKDALLQRKRAPVQPKGKFFKK
ncbi:uncharacterized protein F5Z01DRAFT_675211 [Emericellopsis atlantica]|uniref:Uncharacterized protein n=1 Tax=Emericellopsis atlantica TaxID=2614577 RepID=A0A9P7ZJL1_9HYPO|nr:uncharacterized protein F5Z01DRAFT_675211 [Emericellopsis atlantica]KAG9253299.1 hypothetical protein F5Z01DRAFT_675211 [Emericellopsis atlantica]